MLYRFYLSFGNLSGSLGASVRDRNRREQSEPRSFVRRWTFRFLCEHRVHRRDTVLAENNSNRDGFVAKIEQHSEAVLSKLAR